MVLAGRARRAGGRSGRRCRRGGSSRRCGRSRLRRRRRRRRRPSRRRRGAGPVRAGGSVPSATRAEPQGVAVAEADRPDLLEPAVVEERQPALEMGLLAARAPGAVHAAGRPRDERGARGGRAGGQHAGREAASNGRGTASRRRRVHAERACPRGRGARLGYFPSRSPGVRSGGVLIGRDGELRRVTALLDEARRGRSGTLVLVGEPAWARPRCSKRPAPRGRRHARPRLRPASRRSPSSRSRACTSSSGPCSTCFRGSRRPGARARRRWRSRRAARRARGRRGTLSLLVEAADERPVLVVLDDAHGSTGRRPTPSRSRRGG